MIVVKVRDRDIKAAPMGPVTTGSVGLPVSWHFSKEWDELAKTAVFRVGNDGTEITVAVLEDLCLVPDELLVQDNAGENLWIGVYGWEGEDDGEGNATIAMPTIWTYTRIQDGAQPSGIEPPEGTPGWSEQIQNATDEALRVAHGVAVDADAGEFDGYSPVVTLSEIPHGHRVNITDRDHQEEGQSFDVMDGASAYEQAADGGYSGTEAEFNEELANFKEYAQQANYARSDAIAAANAAGGYSSQARQAIGQAQSAMNAAQRAADSAAASAAAASNSATAAANSATAAGDAKAAAETAQGKAEDAQEAAEQAQSDAEAAAGSATSADNSAQAAASSAIAANDSAASASASESNAANSATNAAASETAAAASESAAAASATAAGNAQTAAETAQGLAEDAQEAAEQAQSNAETAAQSVSQSAAQISQNASDIVDLKSAINEISEYVAPINLYNKNSPLNIDNYRLEASRAPTALDGSSISHPIKVEAGKTYTFKYSPSYYGTTLNRIVKFCDADGNIVAPTTCIRATDNETASGTFTVSAEQIAQFSDYVCVNVRMIDKAVMLFVEGNSLPDYTEWFEPYLVIRESALPKDMPLPANAQNNILYGKKAAFTGDSICYGQGAAGGYAAIIGSNNAMTINNSGQTGATLATGTTVDGVNRGWICNKAANMPADYDYYIVEGGVNDAALGVQLGTITSGYTSTLDTTTICGAMEQICKTLQTTFVGKKYGFLFPHNCYGEASLWNTGWRDTMKQCLKKWGIPYLDLSDECAQLRNIDALRIYTANGDGWHPTEEGYRLFYVPKIEAWMKTL